MAACVPQWLSGLWSWNMYRLVLYRRSLPPPAPGPVFSAYFHLLLFHVPWFLRLVVPMLWSDIGMQPGLSQRWRKPSHLNSCPSWGKNNCKLYLVQTLSLADFDKATCHVGETHVTSNWGHPLAKSWPGTDALRLTISQELKSANKNSSLRGSFYG